MTKSPTTDSSDSSRPVTINVDKVFKMFGAFAALQDVSFQVRKGTIAAFLGPNGAGKSTTMRILTGYLSPTGGKVEVVGFNPNHAGERIELARHLGYLPENGPLYRDMTPLESLRFYGEVRKLGAKVESAIERVVETCALQTVLQKPIHKLSKGFKQRVGMAQALLHDPQVLVLDEPTSGLDPRQINDFRAVLRDLGKEKTILLSTHILQEVDAVADDVVLIHEGRIAFSGSKEELVADGTLESRFNDLTGGAKKTKKKSKDKREEAA